jgi:hypothetical protein
MGASVEEAEHVDEPQDEVPPIYLHIGPMKTGTSFLQQTLSDNQAVLRTHGVLVPGRSPRADHVRAVRDVTGLEGQEDAGSFTGAWSSLRDEMFAFSGDASVVSQEFMSFARRPRARGILQSLAPATVHVVLTVRDASRVVPASWATSTRNRNTASWPEHLAAVSGSGGPARRRALRALDVPRMLQSWGDQVPPERLHVVTVPPPGAPDGLLWERFSAVIGATGAPVDLSGATRRESYGYTSADLMRRVNEHLQDLPRPVYHRSKRWLLDEVLDKRTGEPRVPVSTALIELAAEWNARTVAAVKESGARVVGDLADLDLAAQPDVDVADVPPEAETLAVAAEVRSRLRRRVEAQQGRTGVAVDRSERTDRPAGSGTDPVADAVAEIAALMRRSDELRTSGASQ